MTVRSIDLLGARLTPMTREELLDLVEQAVARSEKTIFANHNMHSLHFFETDEALRSFYDISKYVFVDGMPLVWMARALGHPIGPSQRVTYLDFFAQLLSLAQEKGWRAFHLGGDVATAAALSDWIKTNYPSLQFDQHHGFFQKDRNASENQEVLAKIRAFSPQLLFVGLGMPLQEKGIFENFSDLQATTIFNAGGIASYITGKIATPPRWMGRIGLEWFYRLASEPRRLARRYLVEPWPTFLKFLKQLPRRVRK